LNKLLFTKPDEISDQDFQAVEDVARHLAKNYPPDWLERDGPTLYATTLAISFLVAILVSIVWGPWWSFAIPMIIPGSILIVLPRLFFRRDVGKPRWAHPLVALDLQYSARVGRVIKTLQKISNQDFAEMQVVVSGDQFSGYGSASGTIPVEGNRCLRLSCP
jgi:hypothetical protein